MGSFNRRNDYRDRGRRDSFRDRGSRRTEMFDAVCDECGKDCKVPFRPTGDKPVYCSDCYREKGGDSRSNYRDDRRPRRDEKRMFEVKCDECGVICEVPFKPTAGKPVFCDECFGKKGGSSTGGKDYSEQFVEMNKKLDKVIELLEVYVPVRKAKIVKVTKELKKPEKKEVEKKVVKKTVKKAVKPKKISKK